MFNLKETYTKTIYTIYGLLLHYGELFTSSMERNLQEVEQEAEMSRRRNILKRRM